MTLLLSSASFCDHVRIPWLGVAAAAAEAAAVVVAGAGVAAVAVAIVAVVAVAATVAVVAVAVVSHSCLRVRSSAIECSTILWLLLGPLTYKC